MPSPPCLSTGQGLLERCPAARHERRGTQQQWIMGDIDKAGDPCFMHARLGSTWELRMGGEVLKGDMTL